MISRTALLPITITHDTPLKGWQGIPIDRSGPSLLARAQFLDAQELMLAFDIANDTVRALRLEGLDDRRGWWRVMTIHRKKHPYEVQTCAAWMLIHEMKTADVVVVHGSRWLITSNPACTEDHKHSTTLMNDTGDSECLSRG